MTLVATEHVFLRVDEVRPLVTLAQQRPSLGRWRVIVLEDADRLNDTSGNLLLKAIEEPPPRTVWLLCAPSPDDVLVTIRSRCRHVGLRVPPVADVAELLVRRHGVDPAVASFAARASGSHVGVARRLALDEGARIRRRDVLRLPSVLTTTGSAVLAAAELVAVAAEEAKDATAERDAAERAALLHSLGAEGASTLPPAGPCAGQAAGGEPEAPRHPSPARRARPLAGRPAVAVPRRAGRAAGRGRRPRERRARRRRSNGWRARRHPTSPSVGWTPWAWPATASRRTWRRCSPSRR